MNDFLCCLIYLAGLGIGSLFLGRVLPKKWFCHDHFPYRSFSFEQDGKIYDKLGVRKWKAQFPDMSAILPKLVPSKKLPPNIMAQQAESMIRETCVAEWTHSMLAVCGFACVFIWKSIGGWIVSVLYALGNLPYVIIQRHNRPKLLRLLQRLKAKEQQNTKEHNSNEQGSNTKLQHR